MEYISKKYIKNLLKTRSVHSHKGDFGKILVIAGSEGMAGAAALSARGALRSGAGLVRVSIDKEFFPVVQTLVPCATCVSRDLDEKFLHEHDCVVIGPGLGTGRDAEVTVARILEAYKGPAIFDADALNIISNNDVDLRKAKPKLIITPHVGEAARLINTSTKDINENRQRAVTYLADSTGAVSILKGHNTLVALPGKNHDQSTETYENTTGNPGMATGGAGDVLSGVIGSFVGQGMSLSDAALAGVFVHGYAGDLAAGKMGEYGVTAEDIEEHVAYAIKNIKQG